ncbi:MAG: Holliday junction branch migration protein RuvA [Flavobacteriales bacterium]
MIEYLKGKLVEKSPTHAVIECNGVGYFLNISVTTFGGLSDDENGFLWIHFIVREDAQVLYGFAEKDERDVFRKLISVSGVGANTARMILSGMTPDEVRSTIQNQNADALKRIKGIGAKSAQRIIVDLHDKIAGVEKNLENVTLLGNSIKNDALVALSSLGFDKTKTDKTLDKIIKSEGSELSVEVLIKLALKQL